MEQPTLFYVEPVADDPPDEALSRLLSFECSYLADGGGTLTMRYIRPGWESQRRVEFLAPGTSPTRWIDGIAQVAGDILGTDIEPF